MVKSYYDVDKSSLYGFGKSLDIYKYKWAQFAACGVIYDGSHLNTARDVKIPEVE